MLSIDKNQAMYLRSNLKEVCIYRTMKKKGGRKHQNYFVESTADVNRLLQKYKSNINVIEEYPAK